MVLQNEHFVYAFTPESLFVCDFSTDTLVKTVHMRCANAVPNQYHSTIVLT